MSASKELADKLARRRSAMNDSSESPLPNTSSSPPTTPSPTKSVSDWRKKLELKTPTPPSSPPKIPKSDGSELLDKLKSRRGAIVEPVQKFEESVQISEADPNSIAKDESFYKLPKSDGSELESKLKSRREGESDAQESVQMSANRNSVSSLNGKNKDESFYKSPESSELESKLKSRRNGQEEQSSSMMVSSFETSTVREDDSFYKLPKSDGSELESKLKSRRDVVDSPDFVHQGQNVQSPTVSFVQEEDSFKIPKSDGSELEFKLKSRRNVVDSPDYIHQAERSSSTFVSADESDLPASPIQQHNSMVYSSAFISADESGAPASRQKSNKKKTIKNRVREWENRNAAPLSDEKSSNHGATVFFCYIAPLGWLSLVFVMLATFEARHFYFQLPQLAILEPYPTTVTAPTNWSPKGIRMTLPVERPLAPLLKASRAERGADSRDGYLWTAAGPRFEPSWVAETSTLISNGLALDDSGLLFFCPTVGSPAQLDNEVSLVALDAQTGERKWTFSAPTPQASSYFSSTPVAPPLIRAGCGTPLILNDPAALPERRTPQMVYHATRTKAHALKSSDGAPIWSAPTGVPESDDFDANRVWGLTYVARADALIGLTDDGWMYLLDRVTGKTIAEIKRLPCSPPPEDWTSSARPPPSLEDLAILRQSNFPDAPTTASSIFHHRPKCVLSTFAASPLPNSGRLFVTATARDDQDSILDGKSERAALYVVDVVQGEADSQFSFRLRVTDFILVGSGVDDVSNPVVTADGKYVLIGEGNTATVRAFDTVKFQTLWTLPGLGKGVPTLALAPDETFFAIYLETETAIIKLGWSETPASPVVDDTGKLSSTPPQVMWTQSFDPAALHWYSLLGLSIRPASPISIVGNGIVLAVHVVTGDWPYENMKGMTLTSGIVMLDRETGEPRSFFVAPKEAISDISVGMDGSIFAVHKPTMRVKAMETFKVSSPLLTPLMGGLSRFKPRNFLELARDAACAAKKRGENAAQYFGGWLSAAPEGGEDAGKEDAKHVAALAWQCFVAVQIASASKQIPANMPLLNQEVTQLSDAVGSGVPLTGLTSTASFAFIAKVKPILERTCELLSA